MKRIQDLIAPAALKKQFSDWRARPVDKARVMDWAKLHIGTLLMCVGISFFKFPNHFTTGGISGLSIVLEQLWPGLTTATLNLILNMALLFVGLAMLGFGFGVKTAYVTVLSSVITLGLEQLFPLSAPLTDQPVLELLFAIALPAVGSAILFDADASSGGTDIVAMIVKKYSSMNVGTALIFTDFFIAFVALFVFDIRTGLFSITGLFLKAFLVDYVMDGLRSVKVFTIITSHPQDICDFIMHTLHHSATITEAKGAFSGETRYTIMAVVNRNQALQLQKYVRETDPHCFMTVSRCSHIIGKGFRGLSE